MNLNKKYRDILLFITCLALPLNCIPMVLRMSVIGGPLASRLAFFPMFIGTIYTCYCQYKYHNVFCDYKHFFALLLRYI